MGMVVLFYYSNYSYSIHIDRKYSDDEENNAINIAEEIDLANFLNVSRYDVDEKDTSATDYILPYVVDNITLNFYTNKIKELKNYCVPVHAKLDYSATCSMIDEITINISDSSQTVSYYYDNVNIEINIFEFNYRYVNNSNDTYLYNSYSVDDPYASDEYPNINFTGSNIFLIRQYFSYSEVYDPLAGFGTTIDQIIILGELLDIIAIFVYSGYNWMA